jgi:hypothetical protein
VVFVSKFLFYLVSRFILCLLSKLADFLFSWFAIYKFLFCLVNIFSSFFAAFMASQSVVSSTPRAAEVSRQHEYYLLWRHVTKVKAMGVSGGSWEWKCNL